MKKSTKLYVAANNIIAIAISIISFFILFQNTTPIELQQAIIWAIISGITYRLVFDLKVMNFYIGAMFSTAIIFIFEWWYIPFIYIINQCIYRFSCLIVNDGSLTGQRPLSREIYIILNMVITGVLSAFVKMYFLPEGPINLSSSIVALLIICVIESALGLICIYIDLKQNDMISSITLSLISHLKDNYGIYIIYFFMVINIVVMYQEFGYVGLVVASSYIFTLQIAFDKQAKVTQIKEESFSDVLTGVKNKKFYIESLPDEFTNSCAIFFIDFNEFKSINDKYGHDVGDDVIIRGGEILSKAVRDKDEVIRFGGDEFMLLIADADREICKEIINRIERLCEEMIYRNEELEIKVSMAIGVAICPEESNVKDELATIADNKMYKAKQSKSEKNVVYII